MYTLCTGSHSTAITPHDALTPRPDTDPKVSPFFPNLIEIRTCGSYAIAESLGKVVGNPLVGYFKQRTGGYTADSVIFASMSGAAVVLCLLSVSSISGAVAPSTTVAMSTSGMTQGQNDVLLPAEG